MSENSTIAAAPATEQVTLQDEYRHCYADGSDVWRGTTVSLAAAQDNLNKAGTGWIERHIGNDEWEMVAGAKPHSSQV